MAKYKEELKRERKSNSQCVFCGEKIKHKSQSPYCDVCRIKQSVSGLGVKITKLSKRFDYLERKIDKIIRLMETNKDGKNQE